MSIPDSRIRGAGQNALRLHQRVSGMTVFAVGLLTVVTGCSSSAPQPSMIEPPPPLEQGVKLLSRPLPGPMAALYRMEVPSTGGLRFSIAAVEGGPGRMTVSENFGGAVLLAGWQSTDTPEVFDLREGCRLRGGAVPAGFGLEGLPLRRVHRLLGGRLPALAGDAPREVASRVVEIPADRGVVKATLADGPWRVLRVEGEGFSLVLDRHTSSLPGRIRFESESGEKVELELVRLQWEHNGEWPAMPDLPLCGSR